MLVARALPGAVPAARGPAVVGPVAAPAVEPAEPLPERRYAEDNATSPSATLD